VSTRCRDAAIEANAENRSRSGDTLSLALGAAVGFDGPGVSRPLGPAARFPSWISPTSLRGRRHAPPTFPNADAATTTATTAAGSAGSGNRSQRVERSTNSASSSGCRWRPAAQCTRACPPIFKPSRITWPMSRRRPTRRSPNCERATGNPRAGSGVNRSRSSPTWPSTTTVRTR